jgi:hypothetical protein
VEATLADRFDVVSFDYRGLGEPERGDGPITVATLAEDPGDRRAHPRRDGRATGTGASHGLMFVRTDDSLRTVLTFLEQRSLEYGVNPSCRCLGRENPAPAAPHRGPVAAVQATRREEVAEAAEAEAAAARARPP